MRFEANMITKDGKKMMYLIAVGVNKDCKDYDEIWTELERRMKAVSLPIVRVDWPLYDDNNEAYDCSENLFYAQKFEICMGFLMSVMETHKIRANLDFCYFYNGDAYKGNMKEYKAENTLEEAKKCLKKYNPGESW